MANEEVVLGPRKTMFVLVIVVGCFAVLWPRILSPLMVGGGRETLKPNQFDRDAGCCEVIFSTEVAVLELLNEVCSSAVGKDGRLSPYAAAECRRAVNETCGLDIAAFLKRSDNVGKTTKMLLETMRSTNSSCLREHYGVPVWSMSHHLTLNSWIKEDTVKQERSPVRGGSPHPALRERGRAIPPGAPTPPSRVPGPLPAHIRVKTSPLEGYFQLEVQPPPIPGMRPPLGSPGGPAQVPKSSMGFVMPIYTICIVVFFVYTLSKILFKRTGTVPYEELSSDPQFRRRVFRDDSRSTPDNKLGHKERDARDEELEALRARLAETERAMQRIVARLGQRDADVQDNHNHARPYTNGSIQNDAPVHIIATEYREPSVETKLEVKERTPEPKEPSPEPKELSTEPREPSPEPKEPSPEPKELSPEPKDLSPEPRELSPKPKELTPEPKEATPESKEINPETKEPSLTQQSSREPRQLSPEIEDENVEPESKEATPEKELELRDSSPETAKVQANHKGQNGNAVKLAPDYGEDTEVKTLTEGFLEEARIAVRKEAQDKKQTTPELLEEALKEDSEEEIEEVEEEEEEDEDEDVLPEQSVKHEPKDVKSIYLETAIPQQSKVLVTDFAQDRPRPPPTKHSPRGLQKDICLRQKEKAVVSGKMTLSLIQDAPRDTPDRDLESTFDEFTTASTVTQPAAEQKQDDLSDDDEEEIEIEEIEEEEGEEEEEEEGEALQKK